MSVRREDRGRGRRAIAGLLTVALTAGITATALMSSPAQATTDALAPYYGQVLEWERCGSQQCSWLTVPLDYADPSGETIRIRVSRTPADGPTDSRLGSLVTNPGGPGAAGVPFAGYLAGALDPAVTGAYDIVGFDPRGVGQSAPISCLTGAQTTRWYRTDLTPDNAGERATLMKRARQLAQGCLRRSPTIARHVSTENTVRDMDILRQALGDDLLTFLGYSYGTYLGTRYAELFPERVGRFVLDGAVDPRLDVMEISRDQSAGFQLALERFARDCATRAQCPWRGGRDQVLAGLSQFLNSLERRTLPTESLPLVEAEALTAVFYAMYSPTLWPSLRTALRQGRQGDGRGLSELAASATDRISPGRYATNMASAFPAIACWDSPAAPGPAGLANAAATWARTAKVPSLAKAMSWSNAACSVWFGHSDIAPAPASTTTEAPIVIIGGTYDPATPYEWSRSLNRQLPTSTLLTYRGDGHTVYGGTSRCIDRVVDTYLLTGAVPAPGTTCR